MYRLANTFLFWFAVWYVGQYKFSTAEMYDHPLDDRPKFYTFDDLTAAQYR